MSTVQEVLSVVQFRIDASMDIFPLLNNAISTLAQRLYILDSNLAKEKLEVEAYAEVTYTASTIAFVSGTPCTITDSAAGFVTAGFVAGMRFTTDSTTNTGEYTIATVAAGTLTLASTDTLTGALAGPSITITSVDDHVVLPSTFWGFAPDTQLFIEEYQSQIFPLPDDMTGMIYDDTPGQVTYYELLANKKLYLYPPTSADITIKFRAFIKPDKVTDYTGEVPWDGMFDSAISELMMMFYKTGTTTGQETAVLLESFLSNNVDTIAAKYDKKAVKKTPDGNIDWEALME